MFGNKITKTILIEGMHCAHCSKMVEETLKSVKGVKSVKISLEDKSAEITLKMDVPNETLQAVVKNLGFNVIDIKVDN